MVKSPPSSESSSSSVAKGLRFLRCSSPATFSPFWVPTSEFCFECRASRAASCRRAREGGMFKGGGGGGGTDGGSMSADVAVVVEGVDM